jgi:hypothetical protein
MFGKQSPFHRCRALDGRLLMRCLRRSVPTCPDALRGEPRRFLPFRSFAPFQPLQLGTPGRWSLRPQAPARANPASGRTKSKGSSIKWSSIRKRATPRRTLPVRICHAKRPAKCQGQVAPGGGRCSRLLCSRKAIRSRSACLRTAAVRKRRSWRSSRDASAGSSEKPGAVSATSR